MAWAFSIDERLFVAQEPASVTSKNLDLTDFPAGYQGVIPPAVRVHGIEVRLVTDATVASRRLRIRGSLPVLGVVFTWVARATIGALTNSLFHFDITGNLGIGAVGGHQFETWPDHVVLPAGWSLTFDVESGFAAGDRLSDIIVRGALLEGLHKSNP